VTEAAQAGPAQARPLRSLVGLLVGFALLALAIAGLKGWRDYQGALAHEQRLQGDISAAQERIQGLETRIDRLQHDPATLDRVAREQLGLVEPNEVVVVLPPAAKKGSAANR